MKQVNNIKDDLKYLAKTLILCMGIPMLIGLAIILVLYLGMAI